MEANNTIFHNSLKEQKSEEVQDIISRMPRRFSITITSLIVFILSVSIFFALIIKYPEVIIGEINVTGKTTPVKLVSFANGKIHLIEHSPGKLILENDDVALIKNTTAYNDYKIVDSLISGINITLTNSVDSIKSMPSSLFLGELNASYYTFYNSYSKHKDYYLKKPFDKEIETTNQLIESRKSILNNLFSEKSRLQKKYDLAVSLFRKDSLLAEKRLVSTSDLEKMTMSKLSVEQEFKAIDKEIINVNYQIEDGKNRIQQIMVQKMSAEREIEINLNASYYNLVENLHEWKKKYLITSPIKGKIEFLSFLKEDDFIQTGQELFSIVPPENEILGQMYLPEIGSGKVKIGQEVIIKLNNYPYLQFGSIKGQISRISVVSNQQLGATGKVATSLYLVNVKLVNGLQTNYGKNLPYQFDLKGSGEIITEEKRLIERFFDNLKYRIK